MQSDDLDDLTDDYCNPDAWGPVRRPPSPALMLAGGCLLVLAVLGLWTLGCWAFLKLGDL